MPAATTRTASRSKARTARAAAPETARYTVHLRYRIGAQPVEELALHVDDRSLYPDVQHWRYVVANRRRITQATRESLAREVESWLMRLSELKGAAFNEHVKAMAAARRVEVRIPYQAEEVGWAARLMPWENILWLLTRPLRDEAAPFTVVRHLDVKSGRPAPKEAASMLLVRSGPGRLGSLFELDRECEMVTEAMRPVLSGDRLTLLRDPDRVELAGAVSNGSPALIHLSGVDPWALESQGLQKADRDNTDGFVLRQAGPGYDAVPPAAMAALLTGAKVAPLLVAASSCFSAQRLAALTVAGGAHHAIGFIDTLTDADAMLFFGSFYRQWAQDWDLLRAFEHARQAWITQAASPGTGVVLWTRHSIFERSTVTAATAATHRRDDTPARIEDLKLTIDLIPDRLPTGIDAGRTPRTSLNYSLLHNDRSPFRTFFVDKPNAGPLPPLSVEVALEVGGDTCRLRFAQELPLAAGTVPMERRVRLPLVAGLLRQCTESLRTNLYVKVTCGDRLLLEDSKRVTVLPADEWRDDGEDHRWLPSFVLPRDPAVLKVIAAAQRYLRTLLDDCAAGFDGYQQLHADDSNAAAVVDAQVQAIWAALQHDLPVSYINPPPSYTSQSQRLRTPSEIFRGQAATCIDLALLFASCLEFVGIYPVMFLVEGHAFPGYWRSDKAWWRMTQFRFRAETEPTTAMPSGGGMDSAMTSGQSERWMFDGVGNLVELLRYVQEGTLAAFESTFVAAQRGFFAALEEGSARLHPDSFDAMVDIQSARAESVTPLPLFDKFA